MKKILKYIKPYWYFAVLAPLFMVAEVLFDLYQAEYMSKIVDEGVIGGATNLVIKFGLLMIAFLAVGGLCGILSAACASACANNFGNDLRKELFSKITNLSFEQTDKFTTGSLITRITNDITMVQDFVSMAIRMFIRSLTMFIGGMIFMFTVSKVFGYVVLVALPIEIITVVVIYRKVIPMFRIVQGKIDKVNSVVQENVNGARVVKAFTGEEKEKDRFDDANQDLALISYKSHKIISFIGPILTIFLYAISIAIIYFGAFEIEAGINISAGSTEELLSVGDVMQSLTYVSMILMSVMQLVMISQNVTRAIISANRISEVLDSIPVINSAENPITAKPELLGTVEFKNVSFSYPNYSSSSIISDLSFKVNKGETVAILGATGSGKTSVVNLIPRFYDVTEGEVIVDGVNVKDYDLLDLRNRVVTVLQRTELFGGTIAENIKWGKDNASMEEVIEVCKISQAHDFISEFNNGYDSVVGEKGSSLSGGQKQRVAIARALVKKPEILIFDDSTSALDLETEARLYKALRDNLGDTTVILIAQRVASAKNADKILVIDQGKLVAFDTHDNLINNCDVYIDIYNSQLKRGDDNE